MIAMYMALWVLFMVIVIGGEPVRIPLKSDFITYEECAEVRDLLIADLLKNDPYDATTKFYCDAKIISRT